MPILSVACNVIVFVSLFALLLNVKVALDVVLPLTVIPVLGLINQL